MWATYNEWKANGRVVEQGRSSVMRDPSGNPLFHHSQTVVLEPPKQDWRDDFRDDFLDLN